MVTGVLSNRSKIRIISRTIAIRLRARWIVACEQLSLFIHAIIRHARVAASKIVERLRLSLAFHVSHH